ncbi:MAG TPA: diacylglycerol kinase family protein [Candidatus Dormibacteraeota bacterium]|nr:diacylglycerol kinase family protein [Candidatus Dormibacteraeota bacterium]
MTASTLVVVNPASAAGRTRREWPAIRTCLLEAGVEFDHRMSSAQGDCAILAREGLREGYERIVAVGGDGTLNEVVNGFFDTDGSPIRAAAMLGMIPSGTGGDFRRSAGIPREPHAAAALLARGDVRPIDVGRIDYAEEPAGGVHHFVNIADCGLGGEVAARANASSKRFGGTATFYWASMRAIAVFGRRRCRIEVDGVPFEGRVQNVVVANGSWFGGGMWVAPDARLDDGLLDVVVIGDASRLRTVLESRRIYKGTHVGRPEVLVMRGREVRVTPRDTVPFRFDVDGEAIGRAPATLRVLPGAVRLCAANHETRSAVDLDREPKDDGRI